MTHHAPRSEAAPAQRSPALRVTFLLMLVAAFTGFVALGTWQLQRMNWKHALIERVDARIHATPAELPERSRWQHVDAASDEYRRVRVSGHFLDVAPVRVQAVTESGPGWWVLAALATEGGDIVLINRGFIASDVNLAPAPEGIQNIGGLLRISEPDGAFLRSNAPGEDRWFSRDVAAITTARGLPPAQVAPFFIDADRSTSPAHATGEPLGGLTVVRFRDSHLVYALTWFALAGLCVLGVWLLLSTKHGLRQHAGSRHHLKPVDAGSKPTDE